jgi:hypothetical protein
VNRQIVYGRTHCTAWNPGDSDPITFYPQTGVSRVAGFLMAVFIGASLATLIAYSI